MTDMNASNIKVFGPRFMLAMLLAAFATFAQEEFDVDGFEQAVDTSKMPEPATAPSATVEDERDELEPAVSSSTLATEKLLPTKYWSPLDDARISTSLIWQP